MMLDMVISHAFFPSASDSDSKGLKLPWLGSNSDAVDTAETLGEAANNTKRRSTVTGASANVGRNPVAGGDDVPNHSNNVSDTETEFKLPKLAFFVNRLEEPVLLSCACLQDPWRGPSSLCSGCSCSSHWCG